MQAGGSRDWLALLDEFGPDLEEAGPGERALFFLQFLSRGFGWPASEYWLREGDSLRQLTQSHIESPALDAFERQNASLTVEVDWSAVGEIWPESDPNPRKVAWIQSPADSSLCPRKDIIREAGLNTLVVVPVPNGTYLHRNVLLWDFEAREEEPDHVHALKIAAWLFGRSLQRDEREVQAVSLPVFATVHLDPRTRSLVGPGGGDRLTVYEWDFLSVLFEREGEAVSFGELIQEVWRAPEDYVGRSVVYELVARLRPPLTRISEGNYRIASVPRYGYVLERTP
jgi:hypothetical protein